MTKSDILPPAAEKTAHKAVVHGDTLLDNYFWMRLSDDQKNAAQAGCANPKGAGLSQCRKCLSRKDDGTYGFFQNRLFEEIKGRIKQTDMSVPYKENGYFYLTRYEEGKEYPVG